MKMFEDMRVVDLRAELDRRGLDKSGIKAVLIERLKKSIQSDGGDPDEFELANQSINKSLTEDEQDPQNESVNDDVKKEPSVGGSESVGTMKSMTIKLDASVLKQEEPKADEASDVSATEEKPENADDEVDDSIKDSSKIEIKDVHEDYIEEITLDDEDSQDLEDEIMHEEEQNGSGVSKEEYNRRMEDESINLMLEDDDKMLDYEENDRTDMEEHSSVDGKEIEEVTNATDGSTSGSPTKKESSGLQERNKNDSDNSKSSKGQEGGKNNDDQKDKNANATSTSRNLWVSGLASNTRAQDLKTLFSKHGKVLSAKIVTNAKTPGAKCFGFVTMSTLEDANKCIDHLNRTELHGRMIQVEKAKGEPGGSKSQSAASKSGSSSQPKDTGISGSNGRKEGEKPRGGDTARKEGNGRGKGAPEKRERDRVGRTSPNSRLSNRSGDQERDRRSKSDAARRLSAKDRVVDRRHERGDSFSNSRSKQTPSRRDVLSFNRIEEERERQRLRTRERLMREEERMRRDDEMHLRDLERRQKEEAQKLMREREKLRIERARIEREKQELLRLEREQQRIEKDKLERERDELRKQQLKYEEVRRGVKRPAPAPADRDRREYFDDRKRPILERNPAARGGDRGPHRGPDRGGIIRGSDRGVPDRGGSLRGPERGSDRGPIRGPERGGSDRGNRFNDDSRDSRYERHGAAESRAPLIRGSGAYDDRRPERVERRPIADRSVSRGEGRDHHRTGGPPPVSMRERPPQRDSQYNGGSMSSMGSGSWHPGNHSSKSSGATYGSNAPEIMGGPVSGSSMGGRGGLESQGGWRQGSASAAMSTNERWGGGGGSSGISGRNNSMMDILRSADSYHMGGNQVPVNAVPLMSSMSQGDRFGTMGNYRK